MMHDEVILYDNNEAWIIKKHKTNHINKDCKYFKFDGYIIGCSYELPDNEHKKLNDKELVKYIFRSCNKNCKYKRPKNHITLKEAISKEVDNLKNDYKIMSKCAFEIDRLEVKKTIMKNKEAE